MHLPCLLLSPGARISPRAFPMIRHLLTLNPLVFFFDTTSPGSPEAGRVKTREESKGDYWTERMEITL